VQIPTAEVMIYGKQREVISILIEGTTIQFLLLVRVAKFRHRRRKEEASITELAIRKFNPTRSSQYTTMHTILFYQTKLRILLDGLSTKYMLSRHLIAGLNNKIRIIISL
jgi:hypothetical protein